MPVSDPETIRKAFYERLGQQHMAPLWTRLRHLVSAQPAGACLPHLWCYAAVRAAVLEAGGLITAEEAERRVLILENPGLHGNSRITTSLYAGMQLVLPGEIAPLHRHTQAAIRLALEGCGAYTIVNGEGRLPMLPGDLILTPPMDWHEHGNDGPDPAIWLDGLDIPIVQLFDASFGERGAAGLPPLPAVSTTVRYPFEDIAARLEQLRRQGLPDPHHGYRVDYANPHDGGPILPTLHASACGLPAGFGTRAYRSTDASVFAVIRGRGTTSIGGQALVWGPRDVFVAPSWAWVEHRAEEESVLFCYSDRVAQQKLGLWREERRNDN